MSFGNLESRTQDNTERQETCDTTGFTNRLLSYGVQTGFSLLKERGINKARESMMMYGIKLDNGKLDPDNEYNKSMFCSADELLQKQQQEIQSKEQEYLKHKELLSRDNFARKLQVATYANLGINPDETKNTTQQNITKGFIDRLIVGTIETLNGLQEVGISKITEALANTNLEDIKELGDSFIEPFRNLGSGEGYKTGKGLPDVGSFVAIVGIMKHIGEHILEMGIKKGIKEGVEKTGKGVEGEKGMTDGTDFLEMKGNYTLTDDIPPATARTKIAEFTEKIDIEHLANYPERFDTMLDIVDSMAEYIIRNKQAIDKLSPTEQRYFKQDFMELYRKMGVLEKSGVLNSEQLQYIDRLKNTTLNNAYYTLNPKK